MQSVVDIKTGEDVRCLGVYIDGDEPILVPLLTELPHKGFSEAVFIIGSSHGLADKVKSACDFRLSVSDMTFPHRLMRVILSEQLYRACTIEAQTGYHK